MKHKIFAVSALALALAACDDNDVTASTNNVEGTVEIGGIATSGIPFIGTELSASVADANGIVADVNDIESSTVIAYQWMADGIAIAGATSVDYIITEADEGAVITVSAAYTDNDGFDESVLSSETPIVTVAPVNDSATVTITGDTFSGSVLTAEISDTNGTENISVTYVWSRDGVVDTNITTESYTLLETDIGSVFTVQVTFIDNIDAEEDATSAETAVITAPLGNISRVAEISDTDITDTGELRLSDFGTLVTGALRFRFSRDNLLSSNFPESNVPDPVTGETATPASFLGVFGSSTSSQDALIDLRMDNDGVLSLRNSDIVIDETFEDGVFTEVLVTWDATNASFADGIDPLVTLAIDGQLITDAPFDSPASESSNGPSNGVERGLNSVADGIRTIQWRMGDTDEIVIGNFRIDDIVIYSDVAATTEVFSEDFEAIDIDTELGESTVLTGGTFTSSTQEAVVVQFVEGAEVEDEPGTVAISGPELVGSNLTATVTDANGVIDNAITYQWMSEGVNIDGATASTYTLVGADLGQTITVTVNYTDVDGFDAVDILSPATGAIQAAPVIDSSAGISGLAVSITDSTADTLTDTSAGDSGEIRIDLGDLSNAIQNGSASFVLNKDLITRVDADGTTGTGNVGFAIFADNASGADAIVDVTFNNNESITIGNLDTGGSVADAYSLNTDTFVEVTWVTDGVVAPAVTVTIDGIEIANGTSTGSNDNTDAEDDVSNGLIIFQIQLNENDSSSPDTALVDNILIRNEATDSEVINFTFDDGTFAVGDLLVDDARFQSNTLDATIVDSSTLSTPTPNTISGQAASISDPTSTSADGELRFNNGSGILEGTVSLVINREDLQRTNVVGNANSGVTLFADSTSGSNAIVDLTFNNDGTIDIDNLDGLDDASGEEAGTYSLDTDTLVEFSWSTDGVTAPIVSVSIDGTVIADQVASIGTLANVILGLQNLQVSVGDSSNTTDDVVLVDNIIITETLNGTTTEVLNEDFEGLTVGDALDGTDDLFNNNSADATVVDTSI